MVAINTGYTETEIVSCWKIMVMVTFPRSLLVDLIGLWDQLSDAFCLQPAYPEPCTMGERQVCVRGREEKDGLMRSGGQCPCSHRTGRKQEVLGCSKMRPNFEACLALGRYGYMANK